LYGKATNQELVGYDTQKRINHLQRHAAYIPRRGDGMGLNSQERFAASRL
jgi:hypothetical protein